MASIAYTAKALQDLEVLADFLASEDPSAAATMLELIAHGIETLALHPLVGRAVERGTRELVISRGRTGYIALYRYLPSRDRVDVLAIRHQREAGFDEAR